MKKFYNPCFALLFLLCAAHIEAQNVGISEVAITPDASSILELRSTTRGVLIPRLALTQTTSAAPVTSPATSLLVFNTATVNDVTPGFYYWSGSVWVRILSGTLPASGWQLTGNAGTNPSTNFLGTTDAQDFVIRTNNNERIRVQSAGNVGIGTAAPTAQLHTTGTVRLANYPSGANGAIVRTDASGNLSITNFSGNATDVLLGNGTFGPAPGGAGLWQDQTTYIRPITTVGATYPWIYDDNNGVILNGNYSQFYMDPSYTNTTAGIYVYSNQNLDGTGYSYSGTRSNIKAYSYWGNNYDAAIAGYSYLDYAGSSAVLGAYQGGTPRAELATRSETYPASGVSSLYALKLTGDFYNQEIGYGQSTTVYFTGAHLLRSQTITTHGTGIDNSIVWIHAECDFYKTSTNTFVCFYIYRDGTLLCEISEICYYDEDKTVHVQWMDEPAAGNHTYELWTYYPSGGMVYYGHQLHVVELKR